ncbi:lysosomal pro-x carboxypeptidase [Phtheirospermum japonicum]|uniref:Lysosomal pro-x carboxypeptidase n=1 Tax=Phtheirospermum japonicum TaxID=374723 RepID=A0A830CYT3_9LAMI|nr:lysosomal pro-x carboxypeptidase [Phtheirospermum japonicum]
MDQNLSSLTYSHTHSMHAMALSKVVLLLKFYSLILFPLLLHQAVSTFPHKIHKQALSFRNPDLNITPKALPWDFKTYYYNQTLDHFNYDEQSYATFKQRFIINHKHWGGPNASFPILAYLGAEGPLEVEYVGFINDNAPNLSSLSVFIEHRFYGQSKPAGSMEEALKNDTLRGCFNSAQALADYAEILLHVKRMFGITDAPIVVVGGSYGGMLAAWFRLKYPHIAIGALASSAPVLYFDNLTPQNGFDLIVAKDFKDVSVNCYETIQDSWKEIDEVASKPNGLSILSQRFQTCSKLNYTYELRDFLDSMYTTAAQYDAPPEYPVSKICKGIDNAPNKTDIIGAIFAGVVSYKGNKTCYDMNDYNSPDDETNMGWNWQACSEMVMPIGSGGNGTLYERYSPFKLRRFMQRCNNLNGILPRPRWVTTYYGGHHYKLVLRGFGSNIIFSNGGRDPASSGGVLESISKSIIAVTTPNGSHCLDLYPAAESDPAWLVLQRNTELSVIQGWIKTYNLEMQASKKKK